MLVRAFGVGGADADAEVVAVDDAHNNATVELLHSGEQVTVSQDLLTRIEPDPLAASDEDDSATGTAANQ